MRECEEVREFESAGVRKLGRSVGRSFGVLKLDEEVLKF